MCSFLSYKMITIFPFNDLCQHSTILQYIVDKRFSEIYLNLVDLIYFLNILITIQRAYIQIVSNYVIFQIENDIKLFINNNVCNESCTTDWRTKCKPEDDEEKNNEIMRFRRNDFEQIPHRNRNKKRKKLNLKFQVRGKYINGTANGFERTIVSSGYNVSIRLDKKMFVCPPGFIPRKNRCGKNRLFTSIYREVINTIIQI